MLVNVLWHRRSAYTLRCGDCGEIFQAWLEGLFALEFIQDGNPALLPICNPCYEARKAAGRLCGPLVYPVVVDLANRVHRIVSRLPEAE